MSPAVLARLQAHLEAALRDEAAFTASRNHGLACCRRRDAQWLADAIRRAGVKLAA